MTPVQEWEKLNRATNCKHYIGPNAWKIIDDKIRENTAEEVVEEGIIPDAEAAIPTATKAEAEAGETAKVVLPKKNLKAG